MVTPDSNQPLPPDPVERRFLGELIRQRADDFAARAARALCAACPELAARWKPMPDLRWREHLGGRLLELASSVEMGSPELFRAQIEWACMAFHARGVPVADIADSLEVLRDVLLPEMDPADAPVIGMYLDRALACARAWARPGVARDEQESARSREEADAAGAYLRALVAGDRRGACAALLDAVHRGVDVRAVYTRALAPVQREIGRLWHAGEVTVAEEHFASATALTAMSQLLAAAPPTPRNGKTVLVGAVEGNTHDLGSRLVADFFELAGWRTIYLGANVPCDELAAAAAQYGAHVVGLSAALALHLRSLEEAIGLIRARVPRARIIVGGPVLCAAPMLWKQLGADGFAPDAEGAVTLAHDLTAATAP